MAMSYLHTLYRFHSLVGRPLSKTLLGRHSTYLHLPHSSSPLLLPTFSQEDEVLILERKVLCLMSERKTSLSLES